jgi:hypothetical protein
MLCLFYPLEECVGFFVSPVSLLSRNLSIAVSTRFGYQPSVESHNYYYFHYYIKTIVIYKMNKTNKLLEKLIQSFGSCRSHLA